MNPQTIEYRPEIWLLLSDVVEQAVRAEPSDPDSLYALRLDPQFPLVRRLGHGRQVEDEVKSLVGQGWRTLHLVFNPMDADVLTRLRPLVTDELDIQLHDWVQSPSSVLMALGCPDMAISEALRARRTGAQGARLVLAGSPGTPADFHDRLVATLADWEAAAREFHGDSFGKFYAPEAIDWREVVMPMPLVVTPSPDAELSWARVRAALARLLPPALDDRGAPLGPFVRGAVEVQGGGAHFDAPPPPDSATWAAKGPGYDLTIKAVFDGGPTPAVRFYFEWKGTDAPPAKVQMRFADVDWSLDLDCAAWHRSFKDGTALTSMALCDDPKRELQALLRQLLIAGSAIEVVLSGRGSAATPS